MSTSYQPSFGFRRNPKGVGGATQPPSRKGPGPRRGRGGRRRRSGGVAQKWLGWGTVGVLAIVCIATIAWFVLIPSPAPLVAANPPRTALMEQREAEARAAGRSFDIEQEWAPLDAMSPHLVRAVIVAEDYRFRQHAGVDWVSLAEEVEWSGGDGFSWRRRADLGALLQAARFVWSNRDDLRGRSTITQQLAKNLYFGTERTLTRKALELIVAGRLERRLGKDRILELYLNTAEWGPGVFGAEAAARTYFGRSAASLALEEAVTLAATLPHPLTSNAHTAPSRMLWRRDLLLDRLRPEEYDDGPDATDESFPQRELPVPAGVASRD